MTDPENSAEKICNLLFFRGLLEILNIMMQNYYEFLKTENDEKEIINYLSKVFDYNTIKFPEKLFLNLNEDFEETKNMIKQKVKNFLEDYIKGNINIIIHRLTKRKNKENLRKMMRDLNFLLLLGVF